MVICRKLFFFLFTIFIFFSIFDYAYSSSLEDKFKKKKISYLEFILSNLENKTLLKSKKLVYAQIYAFRVQYQSIGSKVSFLNKDNSILIDIKAVMDQIRYKRKKYKPKLSDCNIVRNLIFFDKYGYGFFQRKNKHLSEEDMKEYFVNNFLNNMFLDKSEIDNLIENIFINVEIISPIKGHNIYCTGRLIQRELD